MVGGTLMQNINDSIVAYLPVYTKEEVFEILAKSRKQIENGEGQNMEDALDEIRKEFEI